jgi:hypothetical protein
MNKLIYALLFLIVLSAASAQIGPLGVGPLPLVVTPAPIGTPVTIGTDCNPNPCNINSTSASASFITSANIVAGDTVIVATSAVGPPLRSVTSVTDGTNTYSMVVGQQSVDTDVEMWACQNCLAVASGATLTVNYSGTASIDVMAARIPGLVAASVDKTAGAAGISATTATLSQTNEIAIGTFQSFSPATEGTGFTSIPPAILHNTFNPNYQTFGYQIVNSTAAVTYTAAPNSGRPIAVIATFKGH